MRCFLRALVMALSLPAAAWAASSGLDSNAEFSGVQGGGGGSTVTTRCPAMPHRSLN